jgi:farnesyl diphosphate synthase
MTISNDFAQWRDAIQSRTEAALQACLPDEKQAPQTLHSAMRYAALDGGKRLRAMLVYAAAEFCGTSDSYADRAAVAVECIHAYSLIHDDLPCMDDDDLRRGKPSCHRQFDEATALLAGDALQTFAFEHLSEAGWHPQATQQLQMLHVLAQASGSRGMAGGQAIDLAHVGKPMTRPALEHMHRLKTGALIQAATLLGALASPNLAAQKWQALSAYAQQIGLAFQVVDDVLDSEADTATLGKTAGKDVAQNKPTYVSLLGLAKAREYAQQLISEALQPLHEYAESAQRLRDIAFYIAQRAY